MLYSMLIATAGLLPPCLPAFEGLDVPVKFPLIVAPIDPSDELVMVKASEASAASDIVRKAS